MTGRARMLRRAQWWIAGTVICALVATVAVISNGYDARETPREEPGVWVAREAGQYARVNTDTGEIDLVRKVSDPSEVVQSGARGVVLAGGNGRAWALDPADPVDLGDAEADAAGADPAEQAAAEQDAAERPSEADDAAGAESAADPAAGGAAEVRLPEGTREVLSAGRFVALRTEAGEVYAGDVAPESGSGPVRSIDLGDASTEDLEARLASLVRIDPSGGEAERGDADESGADPQAAEARAAAIALTDSGVLAVLAEGDGTLSRYDLDSRTALGETRVPQEARAAGSPQLSLAAGDWVLLDGESGELWREGGVRVQLDLQGEPRLQAGDSGRGADGAPRADRDVLVADAAGLVRVAQDGGQARVVEANGAPAQPVTVDGERHAAWLGQNAGVLWSDSGGERALRLDEAVQDAGELRPVFRSNGSRAVLNEMRTGMLWTLPNGALIPLSQWSLSDPPQEDRGVVVVEEVTEQVAPTAVDDAFGVRRGESAPVPVLLNDFDANKRDVLTIVPESLGDRPLPESFGTLQLMPDGQSFTVHPAADASGTATFGYRVTDGALQSETATVTLTVVGDETNTAPAWCPVEGCQREWRVPAIAPGGTLVYPVLEGWVDPEGDVMMLAGAEPVRSDDPVRAIVTADGRLAVRHTDPNAGASDVSLRLSVRDGRGAEAQRELTIAVDPGATPEFTPMATTVKTGAAATIEPLERVSGGSGSYALLDAVDPSGALRVSTRTATGAVEIEAAEAGTATVTVTVRDTVTSAETTGQLRVTATPAGPSLALPALRAFVRPLADSTVDILDAIPGASSRALSVESAVVLDGELRADVIEHAQVRVAGGTPDGTAGRIGAVDVTVAEGDARARGRLTVFQVPETGSTGAIAVADTAVVRAGSVVDIRVLDNDVAAPGERLVLHPDIVGSGTAGELAFASGRVLRYLAPKEPGTYRLSYTAFGASDPAAGDLGSVIVTVLPAGSNRDPQPETLTVRVSPGQTSSAVAPLSGVDPDGDRVRLVSVDEDAGGGVSATLDETGTGFRVSAAEDTAPGETRLSYAVRDSEGGTGIGTLRVIVVPGSDAGAIVASTDYVRLTPESDPAVVRPLDNDIDQSGGRLTIESVVPNVAGGASGGEAERLAARIDLSEIAQGRVTVRPGTDLGTVSYRYTIRSEATRSTADGLIVVQTSERVGAQAPSIADTVLNVRDRAELAAGGVDVVTDKVRWATGDVSTLQLSLWAGSGDDYRVSGSRISGEYRPAGDTVVFRLTGVDASGERVSSYGLLIIPPLDELRLTLRPGAPPITVDENAQEEVAVGDLVDAGPGDRVELRRGDFAVGRPQGACEAISADRLRYTAGREAPWSDTCLMQVRLVGQQAWTTLPVAVVIVPREPSVQASPLTRTVDPGARAEIALADMVAWQGGREGELSRLRFEVSGATSLFTVVRNGATLEVEARADAVPGSQESLSVSITGAGESRAPLTLRVGQAPRDLPRGGTVALQCTVGGACETQLVGVAGEHDPFAGKSGGGLRLAAVNGAGCAYGDFTRVGESGVSVSWPGGPEVGGTCRVGFTVIDAQGRTGDGTIEFDAQGIPSRPSIQQTGYTRDSASFTVSLGGRQAHPEVSGVSLTGGGSTSCTAAGAAVFQCVASGLANGEKHQFTAQAVNSVGSSAASTAVTAWAYEAPEAPRVTVVPLKDESNTDKNTGGVRVTVTGSDDTSQFAIAYGSNDGGTIDGPSGSREYRGVPVGSVTFTATPTTRFEVPEIGGGSATGASGSGTATVIGAPRLSSVTLVSTGESSARAIANSPLAHGSENVTVRYGIGRPFESLDCSDASNSTGDFTGVNGWSRRYKSVACATSDYGRSGPVVSDPVRIGDPPKAPLGARQYTVATVPTQDAGLTTASYLESPPALTPNGSGTVQYRLGSTTFTDPGEFVLNGAEIPAAAVRQCVDTGDPDTCSEWEGLSPATAPTRVNASVVAGACYDSASAPADLRAFFTISSAAASSASIALVAAPAPDATTVQMRMTWGGSFSSLQPAVFTVCNTPAPPPDASEP